MLKVPGYVINEDAISHISTSNPHYVVIWMTNGQTIQVKEGWAEFKKRSSWFD